jgi:hypothetical protein
VCASIDARYDFGFDTAGDYCWAPLHEDCPANNNCDEPKGTGICTVGWDDVDCCRAPTPTGECNPVEQCGCSSKPDTQCRHMTGTAETACSAKGTGAPYSQCSSSDRCPPGYACGDSACRKYCSTEDDCGGGGSLCVNFNDSKGNNLDFGVCFIHCDFTHPDSCPSNLICARMLPNVSLCVVPYASCPKAWTSNGVCDDQRSGGTRVCAMGTDPECN